MAMRPNETSDLIRIVAAQHSQRNLSINYGKEIGDIAVSAGSVDLDVRITTTPNLHPPL